MNTSASTAVATMDTEEQRKAFLEEAHADISEIIDSAEYSGKKHDLWIDLKEVAVNGVRYLFSGANSEGFTDDEYWEDHKRFVNILISAMKEEKIAFRDEGDLYLLHFLTYMSFQEMPEIIEHYASSGEIKEVMYLLSLDSPKLTDENFFWLYRAHTKLTRLYEFDMFSEEHRGLPLEIRLEFSGFYEDEMTAIEIESLTVWKRGQR